MVVSGDGALSSGCGPVEFGEEGAVVGVLAEMLSGWDLQPVTTVRIRKVAVNGASLRMRLPFRGGSHTVGEMRNRDIESGGRPGRNRNGTGLPFEAQDKKTRRYNSAYNGCASLV
jgi:hypothetical protein